MNKRYDSFFLITGTSIILYFEEVEEEEEEGK
jgi:hypothetical protein